MLFWIIAAVITLVAGLWLARPYLLRGSVEMNDSESAISVYRDQMDEIERDLASGLISTPERDEAIREIERRTLQAARHLDGGFVMSQRSLPLVFAVVAVSGAVALGGYWLTGTPQASDQPLGARKAEVLERRAASGDLNSRIALMIERTKDNPESFDDWWTLAVSYASIGNHTSAVEAYAKAAELGGDRPDVMSAYAEAMVLANGNKVPGAARLIFEQVLNRTPDVRARYYIALAKAQAQEFEAALSDWSVLAQESSPSAPWMPLLRRDIVNMARFLEVDVTEYLPNATAEEITKSGGTPPPQTDETRIVELRASLAEEPHDYQGSIELAELLTGKGENEAAVAVLQQARKNYSVAPFVLGKLDEAARNLGLDMMASSPGVAGPTAEDIAAAADMSEEDQGEMIDGMVAGLVAKLEDNPNNPDGWIMLVRSYAVMGRPDKAREAFTQATEHFSEQDAILARLKAEAGMMLESE
ncbi:MAG: c-type cytochrome biogenesis protein CcmI [Rhodobacteraceae bacterium]|nr:c-type cytochrome biogenesis protein CcmI [Paracoccaceae bacterium]